MAPLKHLGQDNQDEVQHDFLVMLCHWHWCQHCMMLMALSMAPQNSFGHNSSVRCNVTFWSGDTTGISVGVT